MNGEYRQRRYLLPILILVTALLPFAPTAHAQSKSGEHRPTEAPGADQRPAEPPGASKRPSDPSGAENRPTTLPGAEQRPSEPPGTADSPTSAPVCIAFSVEPKQATWGQVVTLTPTTGSSFGTTPGPITLHAVVGGALDPSKNTTLSPTGPWDAQKLTVNLGSKPADFGALELFGMTVKVGAGLCVSDQFNIAAAPDSLDPPPCNFDVSPTPPAVVYRDSRLTTTYRPIAGVTGDFGGQPGKVNLHDAADQSGASLVELPVLQWAGGSIEAQVDTDLPAGLYTVSVTRAGKATPCFFQPVLIADLNCSLLQGWVQEVFGGLKVDSAVLELDEQNGSQLATAEVVKTSANNPLTELLALGAIPQDAVKFLFRLKDPLGNDKVSNAVPVGASAIGPGAVPSTALTALFRIKPALGPEGGLDSTPYKLGLDISLDVPGCVSSIVENVGGLLDLLQKVLPIPTMALFYEHKDFNGHVMVALPRWTTVLPDTDVRHWDDRNPAELEQIRTPVANRLQFTGNVLQAVLDKLGTLADDVPVRVPLVQFITDRLVWDVQRAAVIDAAGGKIDLGLAIIDDCWWGWCPLTFDDMISSMSLLHFSVPSVPDETVFPPLRFWEDRTYVYGSWSAWNAPGDFVTAAPGFDCRSVGEVPRTLFWPHECGEPQDTITAIWWNW